MVEILFVVCTIIVWILYHKIFQVMYFDLGRGCLMELMGCAAGGMVLTTLLIYFWYIPVIFIGLAIFYVIYKCKIK